MKGIFKLIQSVIVVALAVWFIQWYDKGHFGKYTIWFQLNTILSVGMQYKAKAHKSKEDTTPSYVYWERNVKNH